MNQIRIVVVAEDAESKVISSALKNEDLLIVGSVWEEGAVLDVISRTNAQIAILRDDGSGRFFRCCQQIYMLRPRTIPVILSENQSAENYARLIQTGVHYIFPLEMEKEKLIQELKSIAVNESTRIVSMENTSIEQNKSRILLVYGAKDGIGKTAFVTNLAVALVQKHQKVAILDLNLQLGDVSAFMGMEPKTTISELLQEQAVPNIDLIRKNLIMHTSGVNILASPRSPEFADGITGSQIDKIIAAMRSYYDYVIIDTAPQFNDVNLSCIDVASSILYLTGSDISCLRNSKKSLYVLSALTRKEKIRLLIGKERENEIKQGVISKTLGYPVFAAIPYDYKTVVSSLNFGRPAIVQNPGSKFSKSILDIANKINGDEDNGMKKSFLKKK